MVGVPRSNGCQTCLQRRVKCDLIQPECTQCTKRSTPCPGYERRWKFYNQTSGSMKRRRRGPNETELPPQTKQSGSSLILPSKSSPSIDERVEPNLVAGALDLQGKEVICNFLLTSFPAQFASCGGRVEVNWIDYVRGQRIPVTAAAPSSASSSPAITWSFRSISTLFVAKVNHDSDKLLSSRHMYSRALTYLGHMIHGSDARRDEALAAVIMLYMYEVQNSTSPLSWLGHIRGLATLIQLRGPEAHRSGFGITLLKSCRAQLVMEAFVRGDRCFLEKPEWRKFLLSLVNDELKSPKRSSLALLVDRAFIEIASCPGLLMETREIILSPLPLAQLFPSDLTPTATTTTSIGAIQLLLKKIFKGRNILYSIQHQLEVSVSRQGSPDMDGSWESFIGPIAWNFIDAFTESSIQGIRLAIALLDRLSELLHSHLSRLGGQMSESPALESSPYYINNNCSSSDSNSSRSKMKTSTTSRSTDYSQASGFNPWTGLGRDCNSESWQVRFDLGYAQSFISPGAEDFMDRMAMSLGMFGIGS